MERAASESDPLRKASGMATGKNPTASSVVSSAVGVVSLAVSLKTSSSSNPSVLVRSASSNTVVTAIVVGRNDVEAVAAVVALALLVVAFEIATVIVDAGYGVVVAALRFCVVFSTA